VGVAAEGSLPGWRTERLSSRGGTTPPLHEWQYVKVGRLFPYVEESIDHGTQWAVFEPNEEPLSELNTH
jgi:phage tail sheath protein FI